MKVGTRVKLRMFPSFRGSVVRSSSKKTVMVVWDASNPTYTPSGILLSGVIRSIYAYELKKG